MKIRTLQLIFIAVAIGAAIVSLFGGANAASSHSVAFALIAIALGVLRP